MTKKIENSLGDLKDKVKFAKDWEETVMAGNPTEKDNFVCPPKEESKSKKGGFKIKDKVVNASDLVFAKTTNKSFDGKMTNDFLSDEYGQMPHKMDFKNIPDNGNVHINAETGLPVPKAEPISIQLTNLIEYCFANSLMPEDLIAFHREHSKSKIKAAKRLKSGIADEIKESKHLNWREKNQKRKTGQ